MQIHNTSSTYSPFTKALHWSWVVLSFINYTVVYIKNYALEEKSPTGKFLVGSIHKPLGVVILAVAAIALFWRLQNKPPIFDDKSSQWEKNLKTWVHNGLYIFLLIMPLSGLLMSTLGGYPVDMFGLFKLPLFLEKNKEMGKLLYQCHYALSYVGLTLIALHIFGMMHKHFIKKQAIFERMLPNLKDVK